MVWVLIQLSGVVHSPNCVCLTATHAEVIIALRRKVAKRSMMMEEISQTSQWQWRRDLSPGQEVLADFSFQFEVIELPENPSDPEAEIWVEATDYNIARMLHLRRNGETMPGQRIHTKLPQAA